MKQQRPEPPHHHRSTSLTRLSSTKSSSNNNNDDNRSRTVSWTVANLFWINDTLLVVYHAAGVAWDNFVPLGALVGWVAHATGIYPLFTTASIWQSTGDAAYYTGLAVMAIGVVQQFTALVANKPSDVSKLAQELRHDFDKRVMDQSVWLGCAVAAIVLLLVAVDPTTLGLAAGAQGVLQGLCLGSVGGSCLGWYRQWQGGKQ